MFSGIISAVAAIKNIAERDSLLIVGVKRPSGWQLKRGDSVSVNGICSTVAAVTNTSFTLAYTPETRSLTTVAHWREGRRVNLERALRFNDFVHGHFVAGHVDGTAVVCAVQTIGASKRLTISLPAACRRFVTVKGSIAVDGVSLTVAAVGQTTFEVALVEYTLQHTDLDMLQKGDSVNIEVDLMARYLPIPMAKKIPRIAIVAAPYHDDIVRALIEGARGYLQEQGVKDIDIVTVPGAFEIPLGCQRLAQTGACDALVALGCIIQSKTDHYRAVRDGVTQGLMSVMLDTGIPIGFGVIMASDLKLARSRAGAKVNYGQNAARAAWMMANRTLDS